MSKYNFIALCGIVAASMNVMIAQANDIKDGKDDVPHHTASLSWEQFKDSCLHPEQFNNQAPPSNIRIQCTSTENKFVNSEAGQVPMPGNRVITFAVFSNKYHVNAEQ